MKIKEIVFEAKRIPRKKGQKANSKKHSDLYTDENPKGTIHGLGFKDEATARSSVAKIRKSGRSHAHKIQAAVAMEQRAKAAGKAGPASIYRKYINSMKKKTKAKNEAAGVGIVTKQNATKDVPVGGEYMNVKKLGLGKGKPKKIKESVIREAEARIQHAEDLVFFDGSRGAKRALGELKQLASGGENVTIKWDGSPAVIFGRNDNGEFIFTDKSGFSAKGYDGKAKSGDDVEKMFMARPGAQKNPEGYKALAGKMKSAYSTFESAVPTSFKGYFKGDLLYFNTPVEKNGQFIFKPNIVQYAVPTDSNLGKKIAQSDVGVVIHRLMDEEGRESTLKDFDIFQGSKLLVIPPITIEQAPQVDDTSVRRLEALVSKNAGLIDDFLNDQKLREMKLTDLPKILYAYLNSKVDSGLQDLGKGFMGWLQSSNVSAPKQAKIAEYVKANIRTFGAIWQTVEGIMNVKNNIIDQLDNQKGTVSATINGKPGGEGYVLQHPAGDIKLVNRSGFSAANRAVER
tara:strand:- start:2021 stop:3562 length:1542 start_codon:yes stop_codon:yes gene_type:complete